MAKAAWVSLSGLPKADLDKVIDEGLRVIKDPRTGEYQIPEEDVLKSKVLKDFKVFFGRLVKEVAFPLVDDYGVIRPSNQHGEMEFKALPGKYKGLYIGSTADLGGKVPKGFLAVYLQKREKASGGTTKAYGGINYKVNASEIAPVPPLKGFYKASSTGDDVFAIKGKIICNLYSYDGLEYQLVLDAVKELAEDTLTLKDISLATIDDLVEAETEDRLSSVKKEIADAKKRFKAEEAEVNKYLKAIEEHTEKMERAEATVTSLERFVKDNKKGKKNELIESIKVSAKSVEVITREVKAFDMSFGKAKIVCEFPKVSLGPEKEVSGKWHPNVYTEDSKAVIKLDNGARERFIKAMASKRITEVVEAAMDVLTRQQDNDSEFTKRLEEIKNGSKS